MRLLLLLLFTTGFLYQQDSIAQVTVPCDVQITYTDGSAPPVPPVINMANGTVNTCSATFYDPGGTGLYSASTALITQIFCSDVPGEQIIIDFTLFPFQVETSFDFLNIYDGVGTGGTQLWNSQTAGGAVNPGMITSTTGCITITFSSDGSVQYGGWQADISCTNPAPPGGGWDCNGGDVVLTAVGQGEYYLAQNNDFNGGTVGAGWVSTGGAAVGQPCGVNNTGTDYYWASTSTGTPNLTTVGLDVSCGGFISFDMAYATQGGAVPCEGPDEPDEGVTFQYSTDGGVTWIIIDYWDPLGGYDPTLTSWNNYSFPIPAAAMGPNTQFQWIQLNSSGTCCDNWGIDNVQISSVVNCAPYVYDWTQVPGNDDNPVQTETVTSTTTFTVWYGNGFDSCYADITIIVPPGTTADAGIDQVICGGAPAVTIGAAPTTLDEGAIYTWSSGETGTIDLTGGGQDNGQINVSPAVTTDYYLEVTFNGCSAFDTVTVTVDAPPTGSNPANINVQCSADVPAPNVNVVTDEADDITIPPAVTFVNDVTDGLTCPETITRTYRITDGCGNTVDVIQLIIIEDTQIPVMAAPPAGVAVQCSGDVPTMTDLGYSDNCDAAGTVTGTDGPLVGGNCGGTITRTWTWTDACGNVSTPVTQTITINDNIIPVMAAAPAGVTVQCIGDVPAMTNLGYTDNCDASGTVVGMDSPLVGGNCGGTITRTWTWTDACGNVSTPVTQIITINDNIAPVMAAAPGAVNVQCIGDVPAMINLGYTDNCEAAGTVIGTDVSDGLSCPETITRTWTYTDACGNVSTPVTQTITVDDTTDPTASNPAGGVGVPPAADVNVVTDEADNCGVPTVAWVSDVSDNGNCPEIITRTYSVTDACLNQILVTQTWTIGDAIMPTASNPLPMDVECIGGVLATDPTVVTDEADNGTPPVVIWEDDTSDGLTCPETILRRYRVTDNCGNFIFVTQTITVMDVTDPVMAGAPAATAVQCIGDVPAMINLGYTDNCDAAGTVTGSDASDGLTCPETITRTWMWTDACGNVSTPVTQIITVEDTQVPVIVGVPAAAAVQCIGDVPAMIDLNYTDNCDPAGTVTGADVSDNLTCPETITRTWTFTDACGNNATVTQIITVEDTQVPVIAGVPAAAAVQCIGDVPAMIDLNYSDNCDPAGTVTGADVSDNLTCPETITRTWTFTDACGNNATVTQIITVEDTQVPVFVAPPLAVTVECVGDVSAMTDLDWTDNCDGLGTVTGTDGALTDPCGGTITRTWTYTDACGNNATVTQIITVDDTTLPTASNPVNGAGLPPAPDVNVVTDEADNCGVPTVAFVSDVSDGGNCPEIITRTYSVTDGCLNQILVIQTWTIGDAIIPTASNPLAMNVECIGDVLTADPLVVTDENDNGTPPVVTWEDDTSDGLSCPETILRRYRVTDNCGNFIFVTQTITVMDVTAPVMAVPPATVAVQCIGDVPAMIDLGYTDNCDLAGTVTGTDVSDNLSCPETITRTWTWTDVCGNVSAPVTQIITVEDTQVPVIGGTPAALAVQCIGDVPAMIDLNYSDNCDPAGTVTGADVSDNLTCPETITRTWTFTDACGNNATVTQIITVEDTQVPIFTIPLGAASVQCIGDVPAMTDLDWTDNCDGFGSVTGTDGALIGGACGGTITRTWTYTDACGNNATVTQTITVDDTTLPTASNVPTSTVPGGPAPGVNTGDVPNVADNCTVAPVVAWVSDVSDNNPCPETITRTYSVTDDCGNTINVIHLIVITDPILPTGTAPGAINVECIGDVPANDPLLITDEADNQGVPVVAWEGDVSNGMTCPEIITRTYSITDVCGNIVLLDQIITVNDITLPTATAPAMVNVECIGDVPVANILDITDEADNCTVNPVVVHVGEVSDGLTCPETITRTYSVTDDCGNAITLDQLIIVDDVTNPTATAPANVNVECIGDVPAWNILDITNEADNCTVNPIVVHVGDVSDGLSCPETITRTYSITDDCGNAITVDQIIVVNDVTLPTASNPVDISVPGSMDVPAPNILDVINEADNCTANPVVAFVSDVSDGNVCNLEEITRTYSVTDDCGNQIMVTQIITILAVPAPIDAGPDQLLCEGVLTSIVEDNPWAVSTSWSPAVPGGMFDPIQTTTYTVTADNLGCISTDDVTVVVEALPVMSFSGDVLSGCEPLEVIFTNTSTALSGIVDCEWSFGGQSGSGCGPITHIFQYGGTYDVTLTSTSATGCVNTITYDDYIYVEEIPVASFSPSSNSLTTMWTEVDFMNSSSGASNYEWTFGDGSGMTSEENPTHIFPADEGGSYMTQLIALSPLGCADTAWMAINVVEELIFYLPNTFTPDGDSYNEYFQPVFTSGYDPYDFDLTIYNRWGELMWQSHNAEIGWDGTYGTSSQKVVQQGTYTWKIEFKTSENDKRVMVTGHVNIIR